MAPEELEIRCSIRLAPHNTQERMYTCYRFTLYKVEFTYMYAEYIVVRGESYRRNTGILPLFSIRFLREAKILMETSDPLLPAISSACLKLYAVVGALNLRFVITRQDRFKHKYPKRL